MPTMCQTFGPGGATMPAMWPPEPSTNRAGPLTRPADLYAVSHGTMWSLIARDDVGRRLDHAEVHRASGDLQRALGELVLDVEVPQVERVHRGGHPGAVGVPGQDVERGRLLAHQPVGHHVVEDQVVGPQDVERARHRGALERALAAHLALQLLHRREVGERAERAGLRVVEHRVDQGEGADPAVARLLQVRGGDGGQRAAEAQPHDVDRLGAGDVADDVERGLRAVDEVVVHRGGRHVGGRVDVADGEHGAPVLDGPLDEAAARREVHHVVLVDPRRARQQRRGVHLLGLRLVLQQLHEVVAEHHLRGRARRGCGPPRSRWCPPGADGRRCCARRRGTAARPRRGSPRRCRTPA